MNKGGTIMGCGYTTMYYSISYQKKLAALGSCFGLV